MKRTFWNFLLTLPMFVLLLILTASIKTLADEIVADGETLLPLSKANTTVDIPPSESTEFIKVTQNTPETTAVEPAQPANQSSVTSVSELSDIQPTDWAFQALQSLVERYGCIVGYPDSTYRGNRALTRYEFAAGLNACLEQIRKLIASSTDDLASKEDLATLERLTAEFSPELANLRGRLDNLEVRAAQVEAKQFSTTTKLVGDAIFVVADTFGDRPNNTTADDTKDETNTFFSYRARLSLQTSFTGKDQLVTALQTDNIPNLARNTGTHMTRFAFDASDFGDNNLYLANLYYRFPVGKQAVVWIGPRTLNFPIYVPTLNALNGNPLQGGFSRFGQFNPTVYRPGFDGAGAAIAYKFSEQLQLHAAYIANDTEANRPDSGLFNSSFAAIAQLTFSPSKQVDLGLTYTRKYLTANSGLNLTGGTGSAFARNPFLQNATTSDNFGLQFNWQVSPKFNLGGWFGYTLAHQETDGNNDATIINSALTFAFPDLFKEGNISGITVGIPPKVTSNDFQVAEGKKIALQKGSSAHYLLVQILEKYGLQYSDIQPVYLAPADARAAFVKGSIDAWTIWDPFYAAAEKSANARVLIDGKGINKQGGYYLASQKFATQQPEIIKAVLEEIKQLEEWSDKHRDEVAATLSHILGIDLETMQKSTSRKNFGITPITQNLITLQQQVADKFYALKLIPKPINVKEAMLTPEQYAAFSPKI